jgi:hypothetical protein
LSKLPTALGVEALLASLALDLIQRAEDPQRLLGDVAAIIGVQIVELTPRVSHTSHFNHTTFKQRLVSGVVVADEPAGPVPQELARVLSTATVGEVVDHRR